MSGEQKKPRWTVVGNDTSVLDVPGGLLFRATAFMRDGVGLEFVPCGEEEKLAWLAMARLPD